MAKGVPILGKDPLGKAKYANVTESGDLRVQLSGTIVEEGALRQVEIAAGATAELDVRDFFLSGSDGAFVRIDDKVQFMLLVQQTNDHEIECMYSYRVGGYRSPAITSKPIPLERRASGFYVSDLHPLYSSALFIIRLTNKSTTTQTYPWVRVNYIGG